MTQIETAAQSEWRGHVTDIAPDGASFTFTPIRGEPFTAAAPERMRADISDAHARYVNSDMPPYRYDAFILIANAPVPEYAARPESLDNATLTPIPNGDVIARIDLARDLEYNWYGAGDLAPSESGLDWLADAYRRHYPKDAPQPWLSPMTDGRINFDWDFPVIAVAMDIDIDARVGDWGRYDQSDPDSEWEERAMLDMNNPAAWRWIAAKAAQSEHATAAPRKAPAQRTPPNISPGARIWLSELPADHPLLSKDAQFAQITRELPIGSKTLSYVITDGQETLTPFAHAAVSPPFTAVHYPAGWIVQSETSPTTTQSIAPSKIAAKSRCCFTQRCPMARNSAARSRWNARPTTSGTIPIAKNGMSDSPKRRRRPQSGADPCRATPPVCRAALRQNTSSEYRHSIPRRQRIPTPFP